MCSRIQKARLAFNNLSNLWRRREVRLSVKGRVNTPNSEVVTIICLRDGVVVRTLSVFENRCFPNIGGASWESFVSNSNVRYNVLGPVVRSLEQALKMSRLRWIYRALSMRAERLPLCTLFSGVDNG